jgi:hypothetical protein
MADEDSQVMGPRYGHVDKFEGRDYMLCKLKIETLLKARELWSLVDGKSCLG